MARSIEFTILVFAGLAAGCANTDLQRYAPPGIFKYEEIASEKEPNPTIENVIESREESVDERFPNLSETPTAGRTLRRPSRRAAQQESTIILGARDNLTAAVDADREASRQEREAVKDLESRTDELLIQLENDAASAESDRANSQAIPEEK